EPGNVCRARTPPFWRDGQRGGDNPRTGRDIEAPEFQQIPHLVAVGSGRNVATLLGRSGRWYPVAAVVLHVLRVDGIILGACIPVCAVLECQSGDRKST